MELVTGASAEVHYATVEGSSLLSGNNDLARYQPPVNSGLTASSSGTSPVRTTFIRSSSYLFNPTFGGLNQETEFHPLMIIPSTILVHHHGNLWSSGWLAVR